MRMATLGLAVLAALAGCEGGTSTGIPGISTSGSGSSKLVFSVQPSSAVSGIKISPAPQVSAETSSGVVDTTFTGVVTVGIGTNPASGTLAGTTSVAATAGVATFNNLSIKATGNGYTLTATSSPLSSAASSAFNITP